LGHRRPLMAIALTVSMLSLAGMPLTAGFIAKFFVIRAGAGASLWGLLIVLALTSAMSLYYYLRVVITMFRVDAAPFAADRAVPWSPPSNDHLAVVAVAVLSTAMIVLGVYPAPLLHLIDQALAGVR
jgi:NADH-quinone oxidoreductase subunit N